VSGTDAEPGATISELCLVLMWRMVLGVSGTDVAYGATKSHGEQCRVLTRIWCYKERALSGTDAAYGATKSELCLY